MSQLRLWGWLMRFRSKPGRRGKLQHKVSPPAGNVVRGSIFDPDRPNHRFGVRVVLEARNRAPEELAILAADPSGYFEYRVPAQADVAKLRLFEATTGTELAGSPVHLGVAPRLEGYFDGVGEQGLSGWAWGSSAEYRCDVDILVDGAHVGTAFAVLPRGDLAEVGIGSGYHGFVWPVPDDLVDDREHEIACLHHGTSRHLSHSPGVFRLSRFEPHVSLGPDGILRGVLSPKLMDLAGRDRVDLTVLLDGEVLCGATARLTEMPCVPRDGNFRCYFFSLPLRAEGGALEVAVPETGKRFPVQIIRDDLLPTAALEPAQIDPQEIARAAAIRIEKQRPRRTAKLLIPVWGERYIADFCKLCLPSLLAPENLPAFVRDSDLEVIILTREADAGLFSDAAAYQGLKRLVPVRFMPIDDILDSFFDPSPQLTSALALTHAYFRGIKSCGEQATTTDFIFWNGDFLAADGTFLALAQSIADGSRCTMAPSIRAHLGAREALLEKLGSNGDLLSINPRQLVRIALRNLHPTVEAKIINKSGRTIENIDRLYWKVGDDVLLCRSFLPFMLHIRPEQVWDDINGFCDYAFVPEMVPNSTVVFEHNSDRICIVELQNAEREAEYLRDKPFSASDVAKLVDYWATYEHVAASKELFVFDGRSDPGSAQRSDAVKAEVEKFDQVMADIHRRLGETRQWHNEHVYWRLCYQAAGGCKPKPNSLSDPVQLSPGLIELPDDAPFPNIDRPRSRTANLLRWTGYDVDIIRESWHNPPVNLKTQFHVPPDTEIGSAEVIASWLDDLFDTYLSAWVLDEKVPVIDSNFVSLTNVFHQTDRQNRIFHELEFVGCRWGLTERHDGVWHRNLGPGGTSIILHRTTQRTGFVLTLLGCGRGRNCADLAVTINDHALDGRIDQSFGRNFILNLYVSHRQVIAAAGRLIVRISDVRFHSGEELVPFGFTGYQIQPDCQVDLEGEEFSLQAAWSGGIADVPRIRTAPWKMVVPTLERLRNDERLGPAPTETVISAGGPILGAGWGPPVSYKGELFRWVAGDGNELTIVRVAPNRAYTLTVEAHRDLSLYDLAVNCTIEVNDRPLANSKIEAVGYTSLLISGEIGRDAVDAFEGWLALRIKCNGRDGRSGHGREEYGEPAAGGIAGWRTDRTGENTSRCGEQSCSRILGRAFGEADRLCLALGASLPCVQNIRSRLSPIRRCGTPL
jgi:hypothetical protein